MAIALVPVIDIKKCTGCGLCVGVCSCGRLAIVGNIAVYTDNEKCTSCHRWCCQCEIVCPVGAISCPFEVSVEEQ